VTVRPRSRYVAFAVRGGEPVGRADVLEILRTAAASAGGERPWLVLWEGDRGLVRCAHTAKETTIALLRGISEVGGRTVAVETLGTSGTVRRARRKYLEPPSEPRLSE